MALVFTNGCFDLIHPGHVDFLTRARMLGDRLVVGLNSDESVRAIRGPGRPLVSENDRAAVLRGLRAVDEVLIFEEPTPARLIRELRPAVLVKGGDWPPELIIGADEVASYGGRVLSLPLHDRHSTTRLVEHIRSFNPLTSHRSPGELLDSADVVQSAINTHTQTLRLLLDLQRARIVSAAECIIAALRVGRRLFLCGNGGSAADAEHIAAEFAGRFRLERRPLPAIALTSNSSTLTSIGNDYGFDSIFARQIDAQAAPGDVFIGLSTSGDSSNVLRAAIAARSLGCSTIGLTGLLGSRLAALCDIAVVVPSAHTARIQEAHQTIGHIWCELVDAAIEKADFLGTRQ